MDLAKALQTAAGNAGGDFYPYTVDYSCRINGGDNLYRAMTGSTTTYTVSLWVKPDLADPDYMYLFSTDDGGISQQNSAGGDVLYHYESGAGVTDSTYAFRDPGAWYHLVYKVSSGTGTLYVNNVAVLTSVNPTVALTSTFYFGRYYFNTSYNFYGYMAECAIVDGQALDPSSFAEDKNGVWVPKNISGLTFGSQGCYLNFADSSNLGNDVSGNNNDFTVSGLTSSDQVSDTPTNNFCTLNPLSRGSLMTPSNGNLTTTTSANGSQQAPEIGGTMAVDSGKWYWEITPTSMDGPGYRRGYIGVGDATRTGSNYAVSGYEGNTGYGQSTGSYGYWASNGYKYQGDGSAWYNTYSAYGDAYEPNDVIGVALDLDNGKIWFSRNGTWQASGDPVAGTNAAFTGVSGPKTPFLKGYRDTGASFVADANFGQSSFAYTPPTGFLALSTANLPEPTVGPNSATTSDENFNTVLWTGTGATNNITGVGFQPDFTWIKRRSASEHHWLTDAVRGVTKGLYSNLTNAEATRTDQIQSFDSDGFTLGVDGAGYTNASGSTYVGWNWKANGSGVSNTDGSITSTVSANQDAGFSIVSYNPSFTSGQSGTVGHGLGITPKIVITKRRDTVGDWWTFVEGVTGRQDDYLALNLTNAVSNAYPPAGRMTSTTFTDSYDYADSSNSRIAYCFAEVEGFSSFGKYTGNGSTDGSFVYTGFRPAWLMIKRTDSADNWDMHDSVRGPYNVNDWRLYANQTNAEASGGSFGADFLSNGFKLRTTNGGWNASGGTYIYIAFAENPFKYSNAR